MSDLKLCPCCGSNNLSIRTDTCGSYIVNCEECGINTGMVKGE